MDARARVERINELDKMAERLRRNLAEFGEFPYVVLSNTRAYRDSYYKQDSSSKRANSMSRLADLPDDINIKEVAESAIKEKLTEVKNEIDKLLKNI